MSNNPWGSEPDLFSDEGAFVDSGADTAAARRWPRSPAVWLAIAAAVLTVIALGAALDGANGYAAVAVAAVGYLLAVSADTLERRRRYDQMNFRRPWIFVALRVVTFGLAVWVGWEAASTLVGVA